VSWRDVACMLSWRRVGDVPSLTRRFPLPFSYVTCSCVRVRASVNYKTGIETRVILVSSDYGAVRLWKSFSNTYSAIIRASKMHSSCPKHRELNSPNNYCSQFRFLITEKTCACMFVRVYMCKRLNVSSCKLVNVNSLIKPPQQIKLHSHPNEFTIIMYKLWCYCEIIKRSQRHHIIILMSQKWEVTFITVAWYRSESQTTVTKRPFARH